MNVARRLYGRRCNEICKGGEALDLSAGRVDVGIQSILDKDYVIAAASRVQM